MSEIDNGGPAFPVTPMDSGGQIATTIMGMSLRDLFAGMALQGLATQDDWYVGTTEKPYNPWPFVAQQAYDMADAMIEARKEAK